MSESKDGVLRPDFSRRLKLEFHGSKVTSDAGLLLYRELDDAVESTEIAGDVFTDTRRGKNGCNGLVRQFRQSIFRRLGRYDDVNDADRLSLDPVMRWIVGGHAVMNRTHCGWVGEMPEGPPTRSLSLPNRSSPSSPRRSGADTPFKLVFLRQR